MTARAACLLLACGLLMGPSIEAQSPPTLEIERERGPSSVVAVRLDRGHAAVPISVLEELGWDVAIADGTVVLSAADEIEVTMRLDSPFFRWEGVVLQLVDAPYRVDEQTYVPLQFLTDFLPRRLPGLYDFDGNASLLRAGDVSVLVERPTGAGDVSVLVERPADTGNPSVLVEPAAGVGAASAEAADPDRARRDAARGTGAPPYEGARIVVIDAGHGGADPGALGPDGIREKTVALAIARRMAERLREEDDLEVHMIRDDDSFVDLWERGRIATELKGERPGIFVSIHANSFPARRTARGFETYFLSDARTEHERRVSAIENAPLSMNPQGVGDKEVADIDFILRDLKNYDHAHWSENLAGLVQEELDGVHPGPNRGVKQGVLAVLTNALMPSVLVEVGYLSNRDEGRLLGDPTFHDGAAAAISDAVVRFFDRYPPGSGIGSAREDR